ncbi:GNAT family N-acetyltransferase [Alteriqipengyuania sp. WL0013]|uniref:GNAT family N-acetyltransferase n=1 Tax=Alteriqipengyuania sp. WL0013 TaxID=3110773 RepID=UPI002BDACCA7|nr:GNAT family N-acetyltransferase [Alteriqipengyuania sp. WL0013]MEB3415475.1 GNAT family N-acetyltransferase [Alteriqipengyuania sp. WL0013]
MNDSVDRIMAVMERGFDPFFGEAWNRRQVGDALVMPNTFAATIDAAGSIDSEGDPVGFTLSRMAADEEELLLIAVLPNLRGRGFGRALLTNLFEAAAERGVAKLFLEMRADNPAETLYRDLGFSPIGIRKAYYRALDGSKRDAITFVKPLAKIDG